MDRELEPVINKGVPPPIAAGGGGDQVIQYSVIGTGAEFAALSSYPRRWEGLWLIEGGEHLVHHHAPEGGKGYG